jgi:hypothetical protein
LGSSRSRSRQPSSCMMLFLFLLLGLGLFVVVVEGYTNTILFPASENDDDGYHDAGRGHGHGHVGHRRNNQDHPSSLLGDPSSNSNSNNLNSQSAAAASSKYAYYKAQEEKNKNKNASNNANAASSNNGGQNTKKHKNNPGAPSRYLEYEGPDATYLIRLGKHPTISYPNLNDFIDTEIRILYKYNPFIINDDHVSSGSSGSSGSGTGGTKSSSSSSSRALQVDDCPRHFLWLSDQTIQKELDYRLEKGRWSERTLIEKSYFTLFYGQTGLASQYMDSVDDFHTDLYGWDIMNRSSNHCEWEGIECEDYLVEIINNNNKKTSTSSSSSSSSSSSQKTKISTSNNNNNNNNNQAHVEMKNVSHVVSFAINGFSLEGRLPNDLYQLSFLKTLDLHGNMIRGTYSK